MQPFGAGDHAPALSFLSIGSGREVDLRGRNGVPLVLVFHLQGTASAVERVNRDVRGRYAAGEVTVASVIDLSLVPTVYWGTVWIVLRQAYERTASELPAGADPEQYVVILPDWGGRVTQAFGLSETGRVAGVAVVGGDGLVSGVRQGGDPGEAALALLESADTRG